MVNEGLIDKATALTRIPPDDLEQLLHPMIDPDVAVEPIAKGLPASPGAAVGKVVFTADRAEELVAEGEKVILVRTETSPEDIGGMHAAEGILNCPWWDDLTRCGCRTGYGKMLCGGVQ